MFQPVSLFVGLRYSRSAKGNAFISFISFFSIAGITLGLAALIVVNSVMNGFEKNLKNSMLALIPHVQFQGNTQQVEQALSRLDKNPLVKETGLHLATEAVLQTNNQLQGVKLQGGVASDSSLHPYIRQGSWDAIVNDKFSIAISRYLASQLNVGMGEQVRLIIPAVTTYTPMGRVPLQRILTIRAIYTTESEADLHLAYTSYETLSQLMRIKPENGLSYSVKLNDAFEFSPVVAELAQVKGLAVNDWRQDQGALFSAVAMEKRIMTLLLTLIVIVAAFNILSAISMMVNEKKGEIAILQTLGFTPARIMQVFMVQGSYNGVLGTLIGSVVGVVLTLNINEVLNLVGLNLLGGMQLPVVIQPVSLATMIVVSLGLSFIATILPAKKASNVMPAEVLRYE